MAAKTKNGSYIRRTRLNRLHILLSDKQLEQLETLVEDLGLSRAELLRRAVDLYLRSKNK